MLATDSYAYLDALNTSSTFSFNFGFASTCEGARLFVGVGILSFVLVFYPIGSFLGDLLGQVHAPQSCTFFLF